MQLFVLGRFPPPLDGQSMLTQMLADLLDGRHRVHRLNTEPPPSDHVAAEVRFRPERVRHYLGARRNLRRRLKASPEAPVLWASVSPATLGHWRDIVATAPAFQPRQPVYAVVHRGNFDRVFQSLLTAATARRLVRRLDGFVFNSELLAEPCAAWIPPEKRFTIPNTIDQSLRCSGAEIEDKWERHKHARPLQLLYLSNMIPSKGYLDVVNAVRLLLTRGVRLRADFIGRWQSDADRRDFERIVHEYAIQETVTHHGGLSDRDRIKALHLRADVFLLPSYYPTEAQPVSMIEALNAGTPIVTTRHSGIPQIVRENEEAIFVPPRSPEDIARAVERLANGIVWRRLSEGARRRFEQEFSPESVSRQWEALIERPRLNP